MVEFENGQIISAGKLLYNPSHHSGGVVQSVQLD